MTPREPFTLTHEERRSPVWQRLLEHLDERIQALRAQNDGPKDEAATAHLRGQIAAFKALQALNADRPTQEPTGF